MCGRYATAREPADLIEEFGIDWAAVDEQLAPNYNVAPTDEVYAVVERFPKDELRDQRAGQPAVAPQRQLRVVRWGLVPSWAKDRKIGSKLINARAETLAEKPAFRRAFAVRRCLLPADGYFEWFTEDGADDSPNGGSTRKPRKQPYFIRNRGGGVLPMAGLYEFWRDPHAEPDADPWLCTSVVITTEATDELGRIHDRMPMLVEPENWARWLDPGFEDVDQLRELLVPAAPGRLEAFPVSTEVNDVRNDGPHLIEPVGPEYGAQHKR
jgi:putative SOS response-associated peptidase YedK